MPADGLEMSTFFMIRPLGGGGERAPSPIDLSVRPALLLTRGVLPC